MRNLMKEEKLNLEILKKSRIKTKPGDIFVFKPKGYDYYFGRTIDINADCGFGPGAILIYIYNITSRDKYSIPKLDKSNLLLPPLMINNLPWSKGYFEIVGNSPLVKEDIFEIHCFKSLHTGEYYDERANKLDKEYQPIGIKGLSSYKSFDDKISKKLGIPLAPD